MFKKSDIIGAIRRIAAENGGTPPGKRTFERVTGIKESDWSGRYWARWSDAVREAGFEPNTLQTAYPRDELVRNLAEILGALGRWPTKSELRLYLRGRPDLPSHNTYQRLGTRAEQARALLAAADALELATEVRALCQAALKDAPPPPPSASVQSHGYVYLLKSGRFFKIGYSKSPGRRVYEMDIKLPDPVQLIHQIQTDDPQGIEAYWHRRFADRRRRGEWFDLSAADVAAFRARKVM